MRTSPPPERPVRPSWLARALIGLGARIVPSARREEWRREWDAELWYGWNGHAGGARVSRARLYRRAIGCLRDAGALRRREMAMTSFGTDLRLGARALARKPGFSAVVVVTLGLGIGASAAIFALLDAVVLRPLPYPDSDRLVTVLHRAPGFGAGYPRFAVSDGFFVVYEGSNRTFEAMGAWQPRTMTLTGVGDPERLSVGEATPGVFGALRVAPAAGRLFIASDGSVTAARVALLAHDFWRERFGGDPRVVGRSLLLNGESYEVVGVLPRTMSAPFDGPAVWVALGFDRTRLALSAFSYSVVGRLRNGVTLAEADADLDRLRLRGPELAPNDITVEIMDRMEMSTYTKSLRDAVVGDLARTLWLLLGGVAVVLVVAWVNVANLVLVRTEGRSREVAIRVAIGAGGFRLFRDFLAESMLLSALAGALGLLLAYGGIRLLPAIAPSQIPRLNEVGLSGPVLMLAGGVVLVSAIVFAVLPALRPPGARSPLTDVSRAGTPTRRRRRIRSALVVFQLALSLVLLAGSGLMVRSFQRIRAVEPGIDPEGVLTMRITIDRTTYSTREQARAYWRRAVESIRGMPGVRSAAVVNELPTRQTGNIFSLFMEDFPLSPGELPDPHMLKVVSDGYARTMGVRVLDGRDFEAVDYARPDEVALVSEALARQYWKDESPVGHRVSIHDTDARPWRTIVGVVETVREAGLDAPPVDAFYTLLNPPSQWESSWSMHLVVRTNGDPRALAASVVERIRTLGAAVPIDDVRTMREVLAESTVGTAFSMYLIAIAAAVSLVLGAVGLYGVIAYVVGQRMREMGVRAALGAERSQLRRLVLGQGVRLGLSGVGIGLVAAIASTRVLRSLLFEVSPTDPVVLTGVSVLLLAIALVACWIPARRASRVHPLEALRGD